MKDLTYLNKYRVHHPHYEDGDEHNGCFILPNPKQGSSLPLRVIASNGEGWDHVSVSTTSRCPTWYEMAHVRDLFFDPHELPVQFGLSRHGAHPYINDHPFCLHWWRAHDAVYPLPPLEFV